MRVYRKVRSTRKGTQRNPRHESLTVSIVHQQHDAEGHGHLIAYFRRNQKNLLHPMVWKRLQLTVIIIVISILQNDFSVFFRFELTFKFSISLANVNISFVPHTLMASASFNFSSNLRKEKERVVVM